MVMAEATAPERRREGDIGTLRTMALVLILTGCALILVLHVVPPTSAINPLTVTISEYGRTRLGWVFSLAVTLIAGGSAAALALFIRARICHVISIPAAAMALWVIGMIGVAVFPKADWAAGATWEGYVHRAASVVAFIGLAVAILTLIMSDRTRTLHLRLEPPRRMSQRARITAAACAIAASVAMLMLGVYVAIAESSGVQWWVILPLGLLERLLVAVELTGLITLIVTTRPRQHR